MGVLTTLIAHHVLPAGAYSSSDLGGGDYVPATLAGGTVEVDADENGKIVRIEGASVVAADVEASNGVIHGVDGVLVPSEMIDEVMGLGGGAVADSADGAGEDGSEVEDVGEVMEETVISAEATKTTAAIESTIALADVTVPEDDSKREELASDLEGAIASVVVQSLDDGDTLESVTVTSIGGFPVGVSVSVAPQLLKRARTHEGRLLRGGGGLRRSLQSASDVEFTLVISRVCDGENCGEEDGASSDSSAAVGAEILESVTAGLSSTETVQIALRSSGSDALEFATVEGVTIDVDAKITTGAVGDVVIASGEGEGWGINDSADEMIVSPPVVDDADGAASGSGDVPPLSSDGASSDAPTSLAPSGPPSAAPTSISPTETYVPPEPESSVQYFFPTESPSRQPSGGPTLDPNVCHNDNKLMVDGKNCDDFLNTGRPAVLENRCQKDLEAGDGYGDGYAGTKVRDHCRLRCDNCGDLPPPPSRRQ